ncbi:hypothetical protein ERO13_A13G212600v2 [Gossypium hirsutum]|uniref:Multiple organellar RNA editing factor 3, mitochondrial isoform X2 n=1 Tax=Gossypium hirsutum TaxID=3635 RepID=A0ABM2ZGF3_GOSHI|nr:multiple organellar RNA editing factor 3, mitochondrial-like isoform X2 [Gossypium hirsutum]KAG4167698.1 hypothetical protein ERO13_A13G212600v2 [Gossypium hirsutum]
MAFVNARRCLSTLLSRALTSSSSSSSFPFRSRLTATLLNKTPVFIPEATKILTRTKTSGSGYSTSSDLSRSPAAFLDGVDYEHWLIILEFPERPQPLKEEMIDTYVKTLASVVGSEEEAKKRIYSVCTTLYTGFRAFFSKDLIYELRGDMFVDGKVLRRQQILPALSNTHFAVGRDDDLWVIPFQFPEDQEPSLGEEIDLYVKTLASVVGSEEEAKKRIYAVSSATSWYTGFRAFISKKMAHELSGIRDSENEYPNEDVHGGICLLMGKSFLDQPFRECNNRVWETVGITKFRTGPDTYRYLYL